MHLCAFLLEREREREGGREGGREIKISIGCQLLISRDSITQQISKIQLDKDETSSNAVSKSNNS